MPTGDATLLRAVAGRLREGGAVAQQMRDAVTPLVETERARTGAELLAFFRRSPLAGLDLLFDRDRSPGRKTPL